MWIVVLKSDHVGKLKTRSFIEIGQDALNARHLVSKK
jgi:hypothetical protein